MLNTAHQGYIYQDIISAYFVAKEIAEGRSSTSFLFDHKKTRTGIPDKFDDITWYTKSGGWSLQVKYSNKDSGHTLTKIDFSSSSAYDLALYDLFETWKALRSNTTQWRVCLAWESPVPGDPILEVLKVLPIERNLVPGTTCYQFDIDCLWPSTGVLSSWRALKSRAAGIERKIFKEFLEDLILEVGYPKSSLLKDRTSGLERFLYTAVEQIGIGVYPNDSLTVRTVVERLCTTTCRYRSLNMDALFP